MVVTLDTRTDFLALHRANPARYPFLLQTLGEGGWDILFAFPRDRFSLSNFPHLPASLGFFHQLENICAGNGSPGAAQEPTLPVQLPFRGGWFAYLGYELLEELEPAVDNRVMDTGFPAAHLARIPAAVLRNKEGKTFLFAETGDEALIDAMVQDLNDVGHVIPKPLSIAQILEDDPVWFLHGVERIKQYIREGDIFQANLARRWKVDWDNEAHAPDLFAQLRETNPAPFSGLADFGEHQIVSSSPERLVRVVDGVAETRPIAGTHPRSADAEEDLRLREALIRTPKERAEHIMLVDLERNDLGRICIPGTVKVEELMAVSSYRHVHHIESLIRGRLQSGTKPANVLRALFPGGTITGCPKVRAMQIIRELEPFPRLAYTGSMGYINHDGTMDFNILIRSFMVEGRQASFYAGAGIVADSEPARELAETRAKAKGLLRALGVE